MDNSQPARVVLVHGAGAGPWVWQPLGKELDARGIEHVEVDLPTMDQSREPTLTFHDDADHVRSVLEQLDGPIVLVGNSYGGVVITEASADQPNVVRLVYLAAFMPNADEEIPNSLMANCTPDLVAAMSATADGRSDINSEIVKKLAHQQATPEAAEWAVSKIRPMAAGQAGSPTLTGVGWRKIPSTYIVCSEDNSIKPEAQRQWAAQRATDQIDVPFDHCPQVSHPAEIADLLARIVAGQPA
jgi:pimeloyl-ACP methyl ester carboxylesterase